MTIITGRSADPRDMVTFVVSGGIFNPVAGTCWNQFWNVRRRYWVTGCDWVLSNHCRWNRKPAFLHHTGYSRPEIHQLGELELE